MNNNDNGVENNSADGIGCTLTLSRTINGFQHTVDCPDTDTKITEIPCDECNVSDQFYPFILMDNGSNPLQVTGATNIDFGCPEGYEILGNICAESSSISEDIPITTAPIPDTTASNTDEPTTEEATTEETVTLFPNCYPYCDEFTCPENSTFDRTAIEASQAKDSGCVCHDGFVQLRVVEGENYYDHSYPGWTNHLMTNGVISCVPSCGDDSNGKPLLINEDGECCSPTYVSWSNDQHCIICPEHSAFSKNDIESFQPIDSGCRCDAGYEHLRVIDGVNYYNHDMRNCGRSCYRDEYYGEASCVPSCGDGYARNANGECEFTTTETPVTTAPSTDSPVTTALPTDPPTTEVPITEVPTTDSIVTTPVATDSTITTLSTAAPCDFDSNGTPLVRNAHGHCCYEYEDDCIVCPEFSTFDEDKMNDILEMSDGAHGYNGCQCDPYYDHLILQSGDEYIYMGGHDYYSYGETICAPICEEGFIRNLSNGECEAVTTSAPVVTDPGCEPYCDIICPEYSTFSVSDIVYHQATDSGCKCQEGYVQKRVVDGVNYYDHSYPGFTNHLRTNGEISCVPSCGTDFSGNALLINDDGQCCTPTYVSWSDDEHCIVCPEYSAFNKYDIESFQPIDSGCRCDTHYEHLRVIDGVSYYNYDMRHCGRSCYKLETYGESTSCVPACERDSSLECPPATTESPITTEPPTESPITTPANTPCEPRCAESEVCVYIDGLYSCDSNLCLDPTFCSTVIEECISSPDGYTCEWPQTISNCEPSCDESEVCVESDEIFKCELVDTAMMSLYSSILRPDEVQMDATLDIATDTITLSNPTGTETITGKYGGATILFRDKNVSSITISCPEEKCFYWFGFLAEERCDIYDATKPEIGNCKSTESIAAALNSVDDGIILHYSNNWVTWAYSGDGRLDFRSLYVGCSVTLSRTTTLDRFMLMRECPDGRQSSNELFFDSKYTSAGLDFYPFVAITIG